MSGARPIRQGSLLSVLITLCWVLLQATSGTQVSDSTAMGAPAARAAGSAELLRERAPAHTRAAPASHIYFAEGYTGQGPQIRFAETLAILNTNSITTTGQIQYFYGGGNMSTVPITIPPRARLVEDVARDVGPNQQVSALVEGDLAISATRSISRTITSGALSESVSSGEAALSQYWYFAEGYTGVSFQEYLAICNPNDTPANVTIEPYGVTGSMPAAPITRTVPAHSRVTVNVRAVLPNRSLGLLVQADQPIAAERTLYWGAGAGSAKYGSAVNEGVGQPAAQWLFPYVSTANGDQVFLALINTNSVEAHVRLSLYSDTGTRASSLSSTVQPGTRATVVLPSGMSAGGVIGVVVSSDVPVACEEAQYFGGSPNIGSHAGSIFSGGTQALTNWIFPGFDTTPYTTERWFVLNTGAMQAHLTATLFTVEAQPKGVHFLAAPDKLTSISLADMRDLQSGSASVWSSDAPVIVVQVVRGALPSLGMVVPGVPWS